MTGKRSGNQGIKPARPEGIESVEALFLREEGKVDDCFQERYQDLGSDSIDSRVFTSRHYCSQEYKLMWSKVWQMACREEELPRVGSHYVYEIGRHSFLIIRGEDDTLRAFYNSCLHRGRKLKTSQGCSKEIRCPFHAYTWRLDGELKHIPAQWDFCHIKEEQMTLPQIRLATWQGFVFINMDPDCAPLEEYLGEITEHFERWRLDECSKVVHVRKRIPCNWKVAMEAFMEAYHSQATHPQILSFSADANSQYDILGDHVSRAIHPMGVQSEFLPKNSVSQQQILDTLTRGSGRVVSEHEHQLEEGQAARDVMARMSRDNFSKEDGHNYERATNAEMLDAIVYNVFPNFSPWGGYVPNIVYRWLPDGEDPDSCYMDVMVLKRNNKDAERVPPVPLHSLEEDEKWSDAEELGALGPIFDQDMGNMPFVQSGMHAAKEKKIELANFQEVRIRHTHKVLDMYMQGWQEQDDS
ncbi:aromatic ring-hydroxylating dioxygenase subunit alpha [Shewanella corallii]|uniref:Aromatic ring-hydroxylating dioxygenase subunit alpha n=1 Tax=Shewanella corallii TaxID=560080 RepID=A0ABT0NAM7_9GAMM|nr:aromatic ring-hydroxylating dioxygenase subunit alpha [Shewanella corallii]MCL2915501.1 aromatic ring-hydroxylating dioxygenase subunit alpha [Shewanella corallii]